MELDFTLKNREINPYINLSIRNLTTFGFYKVTNRFVDLFGSNTNLYWDKEFEKNRYQPMIIFLSLNVMLKE